MEFLNGNFLAGCCTFFPNVIPKRLPILINILRCQTCSVDFAAIQYIQKRISIDIVKQSTII